MTGNQLQWLNCDRLYTNFYTLDLLKLFKYNLLVRSIQEKKLNGLNSEFLILLWIETKRKWKRMTTHSSEVAYVNER